ncbi:tRNA synthetases class I (M)-domain-containing protein [Xylariaceae sp. FL0016]|nr:tRNA synthetases class I (M)-domain-containing protein [Xylariaceae sp. FL0016]
MRGFLGSSSHKTPLFRPRNGWACQACRAGIARASEAQYAAPMRFSTYSALRQTQQVEKPYYVTTPIFYVNSSPHIGHLYSMLIADVLKRWQLLAERPAIMSTGTDEHGLKVQRAAVRQDLHPKALCDATSETFRDLAREANISNDAFIRTTDPEHRDAVEYFWERLKDTGYVYESKHEGWYCVSDETFYPESMIEKRVSRSTGKPFLACTETGNAVEWTVEKNYHFRLTAFRDRLLSFYKENPGWVVPATRYNEVIDWVQNHLEDLSISRPASRLEWGIPVPDDPSQTIYVWLDALVNYLTVAGYPNLAPGSEHTLGWPADVHVVGKDIIRFHCVYWPAFLLALNLPLPSRVLSHGHWLMSRKKMSKSIGNVVNPFFALDRWGVDVLRYFLLYNGHVTNDTDYNNSLIVERYKKGLQSGIGNLLSRVTKPKTWNVRNAVLAMKDSEANAAVLLPVVEVQKEVLQGVTGRVEEQMKALDPGGALREVIDCNFTTNRFFQEAEPWARAKEGDLIAVNQIIYHAAESLRISGILLQPFMPEKAAQLLDQLGVAVERRTLKYAQVGADLDYGTSLVEVGLGPGAGLFPPLAVED